MKARYFSDCQTNEEVKVKFKDLAKKLHPDCGGDAEEFKRMMQEYEEAFSRCKDIHARQDGTTYRKETRETPEQFAGIVEALIHLDGLILEMCGSWLWISGNTYAHREKIKEAGCFWSKGKKQWFWNGEKEKGRYRGRLSMEQIRAKYGSQTMETEGTRRIA